MPEILSIDLVDAEFGAMLLSALNQERAANAGAGPPPQPCRPLCQRRAEDDRFLHQRARLRGQRRRRGRPHHLPVAQPERSSSGGAGARPHHRCRDGYGAAGVVQCRHPAQCAEGVPQDPRRRLRGHPPDLPRQRLVGVFPGPRGQPDRDVLRYALVRAAAPGLQDRPRQERGRTLPGDRGVLPRPRRVQADRGMARRDQPEDRRQAGSVIEPQEKQMTEIKGYHAHVYYDAGTKPKARQRRETVMGNFKVEPGAFSDEPRGPHPISQFNVIFETPEFQKIVPWLMLNRDGLDVLVHPLTDSSYNDHTALAMWLGGPAAPTTDPLRHPPGGG